MRKQVGKYKVAIVHQGFIPIYRVPFFENLSNSFIEFCCYYSEPISGTGHKGYDSKITFPNKYSKMTVINLPIIKKQIAYQHILIDLLSSDYDAVVLGLELKFVSNIIIWFILKILKRTIVWWGQGYDKGVLDNKFTLINKLSSHIKLYLAKRGDSYICYTKSGMHYLKEKGMDQSKLFVAYNTIDIEREIAICNSIKKIPKSEIQNELKIVSDNVLLYIGRIYPEKQVELLVDLSLYLTSWKIEHLIIVIGTGPCLNYVKQIANEKKCYRIRFEGEIYDSTLLGKYFYLSKAVVIPGKVGLAVNHAFAHGKPVITRFSDLHAPEIEYIIHNVNGIITSKSIEDFCSQVKNFLMNDYLQQKLCEGVVKTRNYLTIDYMVSNFREAVMETIKESEKQGRRAFNHGK